jgi:hypothetical protein
MGLAERKAIQELKDKTFPASLKKIQDAASFPVEVDVKWDSFSATDSRTDLYNVRFEKVYVTPLADVLKEIAVDDMGKSALKSGLKKIIIDGSSGSHPNGFTFNDGQLNITHKLDSNIDDVDERKRYIKKLLESKL